MIRPNRTPAADPPRRRRQKWLILAALLVLLGWWLWPDGRLAKARGLRDELFSEAGQALTPEERQAKFAELRTMTREMSEAQRRELSKDMLRRREDDLRKYAELSPTEKKQRLDKDVDRQEERRRQQAQNPPGTNSGGPRRGRIWRPWRSGTGPAGHAGGSRTPAAIAAGRHHAGIPRIDGSIPPRHGCPPAGTRSAAVPATRAT